jgi:hypothetical protein
VCGRRPSQVEGPRLHGAEVLPRLLRHLQRRPRLAARNHVPPYVNLGANVILGIFSEMLTDVTIFFNIYDKKWRSMIQLRSV